MLPVTKHKPFRMIITGCRDPLRVKKGSALLVLLINEL